MPSNAGPDTTTAAGYLSVSITHPLRDTSEKPALCAALKIPKADCGDFQDTAWDNATGRAQVLTALKAQNRSGPTQIRGRIDLTRIAIAGFAEGSSAPGVSFLFDTSFQNPSSSSPAATPTNNTPTAAASPSNACPKQKAPTTASGLTMSTSATPPSAKNPATSPAPSWKSKCHENSRPDQMLTIR